MPCCMEARFLILKTPQCIIAMFDSSNQGNHLHTHVILLLNECA